MSGFHNFEAEEEEISDETPPSTSSSSSSFDAQTYFFLNVSLDADKIAELTDEEKALFLFKHEQQPQSLQKRRAALAYVRRCFFGIIRYPEQAAFIKHAMDRNIGIFYHTLKNMLHSKHDWIAHCLYYVGIVFRQHWWIQQMRILAKDTPLDIITFITEDTFPDISMMVAQEAAHLLGKTLAEEQKMNISSFAQFPDPISYRNAVYSLYRNPYKSIINLILQEARNDNFPFIDLDLFYQLDSPSSSTFPETPFQRVLREMRPEIEQQIHMQTGEHPTHTLITGERPPSTHLTYTKY